MSAYRIVRTCIDITVLFLFVFSYSFPRIACWKFEAANLPEDTFIWKFAVWRNRAFLNIPRCCNDRLNHFGRVLRTDKLTLRIRKRKDLLMRCKQYVSHALPKFQSLHLVDSLVKCWHYRDGKNESLVNGMTLFEAIWPESNFSRVKRSKLFSSDSRGKPIDDGCPRSIVKLDVDIRGRLWLLQVPDSYDCWARIVVYNLKRRSNLVLSTDLSNVPAKNLRALVIDASGSKAYLGDPGDESIIAFLPEKERWWRIMMVHGPEVPRVVSTDIAISRNNSVLYMSGSDTLHLFSINLDKLWNEQNVSTFNDVVWHGTKMGTSSGLICDFNDGLHYFMSSERASVRWDTKLPFRAESHTILVQNENCPCITDYTIDSRKNLWGLVNSKCRFASQESSPKFRFKSRTIKIMKYPTL